MDNIFNYTPVFKVITYSLVAFNLIVYSISALYLLIKVRFKLDLSSMFTVISMWIT